MYRQFVIGLLFCHCVHGFNFFEKETPIQKLDEKTWLLPRTLTYLSHQFPPKEDGTIETGKSDDWQMYVDEKTSNGTMANRIFWRDYNYQGANDSWLDLDLFSAYVMANPAHRVTEYAGDKICSASNQDHLGTNIVQIYAERGMPIEIPCYSCSRNQRGLLTSFYELDRSSILLPSFSNRDFHQNGRATPYLAKYMRTLHDGLPYHKSNLVQYVTRGHGGHVEGGPGETGAAKGRLQISPPNRLLLEASTGNHGYSTGDWQKLKQFFGEGISIQCTQSIDNVPKPTDVLVNVDTLVNAHSSEPQLQPTYSNYETWSSSWKPTIWEEKNLMLNIAWDDWSCCSACCCNAELCGIFATAKKCASIYSSRFRIGYLSLMKFDRAKPVSVFTGSEADASNNQLDMLLSVSPYRERGIAVYSTLLTGMPGQGLDTTIKDMLIEHLQERQLSPDQYSGVGMFVDEKTCDGDPQKTNCSLLAACKGVPLAKTREEIIEEAEPDPCDGEELHTLTLSEKKNNFKVEEGKSYLFKIDGSQFTLTRGKSIRWKVSLHVAQPYNQNQPCSKQGRAVHPNGRDLLMTSLSKQDTTRRIEATLDDGTKIVAILANKNEQGSSAMNKTSVIIWSCVIVGFIILLVTFIVVIDKVRMRRAARIIENREKKEAQPAVETSAAPAQP